MAVKNYEDLRKTIDKAVGEVKITDIHTHIYPACFKDLLLWGIDELLTYHYLVAETLRWVDMPYDEFWGLDKRQQADLVWDTLFLKNSPYSEACRGVLTVLKVLGLDVGTRDLDAYRRYFDSLTVDKYLDLVFERSGVKEVVMTNDVFDERERKIWLTGYKPDKRFRAALRIDPLLMNWNEAWQRLKGWGYDVHGDLSGETFKELQRFLREWVVRMDALYMAVSLPPDFVFPDDSARGLIIRECILKVCRELDIPFALMMGVKKLVNPGLALAGDSVGKAGMEAVEHLCAQYPENKFMVTMLSRENQHELCVTARKFRNLMIFGCWWFLNNPSIIDEITRMRFEMLGVSVIPQHSDARVVDQLIYKWEHSKKIIAHVLYDQYRYLMDTGWSIEEDEILRDVEKLFGGNFHAFIKKKA